MSDSACVARVLNACPNIHILFSACPNIHPYILAGIHDLAMMSREIRKLMNSFSLRATVLFILHARGR